jgi:hypothetical protein
MVSDESKEIELMQEEAGITEEELKDAKSIKESMDCLNAFCGLMAGFEAFIINEYVNSDGLSDSVVFNAAGTDVYEEAYTNEFKFGLFILIISFCFNLAAAMGSFLWGVFLREGIYRVWFRTVIGRSVKLMAFLGVFTFFLGVMFFIDTIGLGDGYTITIFTVTAFLFLSFGAGFFYTMVGIVPNENMKRCMLVMDAVN